MPKLLAKISRNPLRGIEFGTPGIDRLHYFFVIKSVRGVDFGFYVVKVMIVIIRSGMF